MREAAMVVAGLAAGTGIAAWTLVRNLGEGLPSSWGDTVFNAWILAWNADRLRHGLRGYWDAPLFYPYSDTLAFSEHLLGIGIFTAPIQWLTGNPIVAQNMAFLASYLLAGGGMYLLVRDLTGSRLAGFVSGVAFAFLPYRTFDTRIQVLMYGWTPLALWALHRYFTTGRRAALAAFAVAFLLQGLSNGYAFYSAAVAVIVVVAVGLPARRWMRLRTLIDLTVTAVLMLVLLLPVIGAYRRARVEHDWYRARAENVRFSASARQYLPAWRPPAWGNRYRLSPGLALSGLAALGAGAALFGRRRRTGLTYAAVAGVGFILSLGPEPAVGGVGLSSGPYDWLLAVVPGLDGLREPERFAVLVYVGAAVLAGFGVRLIVARAPRGVAAALCLALAATTFVEGYDPVKPVPFRIPPSVHAAYLRLANRPPGAVVELPFNSSWEASKISQEAYQVYGTLVHGHPIVTGYSGYFPPLFWLFQGHTLLHNMEPGIVPALRALGVRYVLVHEELYEDKARADAAVNAILSNPGQLASVETVGATTLVTLRPASWSIRREPLAGAIPIPLSAEHLRASHGSDRLPFAVDGDPATRWMSLRPQSGDEQISVGFSSPTAVVHVRLGLAVESFQDYPRHLVVEGSVDGQTFSPLYDGSVVPQFVLGAVDSRRYVMIDVALPPLPVRVLRLRQTGRDDLYYWSINELQLWELPADRLE